MATVFVLLFLFSIFSDQPSLKIENKNNSMKTLMQKFDHRSIIYGIKGALELVLVRQGK